MIQKSTQESRRLEFIQKNTEKDYKIKEICLCN